MPNGCIDPDVIVENILLFGSLIVFARKLSKLPLDANTYRLLWELDDPSKSERERLEVLLSMLFKEEKNREVFRRRYEENLPLYLKNVDEDVLNEEQFDDFSLKDQNVII